MKITLNGISSAIFSFTKKHAEQHETLTKAVEQLTTQTLLNTKDIGNHEKRLDEGNKDFKEIKKSIAGLEKSYAVLADRAERRRDEFGKTDKEKK